MAAEQRRWRPSNADGGRATPMAAEQRRWRPSNADGPRSKSQRTTAHDSAPRGTVTGTNRRIHRRIRSAAEVKPRPPDAEHCPVPCARCAPDVAGHGPAPPMAAERRRWPAVEISAQPEAEHCSVPSADGGRAPPMAAECHVERRPSTAASPPPKSNLIKLLKDKCGEEMKSGTISGDPGPALVRHNNGG
jgi:hypothetical protein